MKRYSTFLILGINLILCGVVSAQPLRRVADDNGVSVDFSTSDKQDTVISSHGRKLDRLETTSNAIQSAVELVRWIDASNTTSSTLGNGEVFSGPWVETTGFMSAIVNILTDEDSATNGFEILSSDDGVGITHSHEFTMPANDPLAKHLVFTLVDKYYRIKYTNGTTPQGSFHLGVSLSKTDATHSHTHPIEFPITGDHEAQLGRTVLVAKTAAGPYANIEATNGANLKVSIEELESGISENSNTQLRVTEFNSVGSELWDTADHAGYVQVSEIYSGSNNIGAIEIVDPDDDTRRVKFDPTFKALLWIDIEHHEIHEGHAFVAQGIDVSMANNDTIILAFKTPSTKEVHLVIDYSAKAAAHVDLIESPTWSTSTGSQVAVYNRNRNSANTTELLEDTGGSFVDSNNISLNPGSLTGGTIIPDGHPYAFAAPGIGGQTRSRGGYETVLDADTQYAIRGTADAATNAMHIKLRWYEHTPG